jgi:aspartyl-tRNA(Asn)/glutamyl-tRNA(Gln) amidotransferase subunit C
MKLDLKVVENVAHLARLGLSEAEKEQMREELAPIIEYFEVLNELDTSPIPPTAQVITVQNLMRPDEVEPSVSSQEALANAPAREDDYFRVRPIFGKDEE